MPQYTYRCNHCEHEFDTTHSITQDALKTCPECQKDELRKVINFVPGIAFKGSGFYVTDNKKQAAKTPAPKTPKTESKENSTSENKENTEAKPVKETSTDSASNSISNDSTKTSASDTNTNTKTSGI